MMVGTVSSFNSQFRIASQDHSRENYRTAAPQQVYSAPERAEQRPSTWYCLAVVGSIFAISGAAEYVSKNFASKPVEASYVISSSQIRR